MRVDGSVDECGARRGTSRRRHARSQMIDAAPLRPGPAFTLSRCSAAAPPRSRGGPGSSEGLIDCVPKPSLMMNARLLAPVPAAAALAAA